MLIVLLVAPAPIAERYTSATQDGQFLIHPIRSYGFIVTLARASGSARLGNPGEALMEAKQVFAASGNRAVRVALLYLPDRASYLYVTRAGTRLTVVTPPTLVWEIWGRPLDPSSEQASTTDVIGFLDYRTGAKLATSE